MSRFTTEPRRPDSAPPDPLRIRGGFREYTVTFDTDDYLCLEGVGLTPDDVIDKLQEMFPEFRADPSEVPGGGGGDLVIWEADRVVAVLRADADRGEFVVTRLR